MACDGWAIMGAFETDFQVLPEGFAKIHLKLY